MNNLSNITEEEFERIEKYLLDTSSAEEKQQIEEEISSNTTFAAKVKDVQHLVLGIEVASLKNTMNQFHEELIPSEATTKKPTHRSRAPWYAIAAMLIVLLGLFWVFNNKSDSEKLFAKHFTPDPGLPTTMSENSNFKFYDGMVSYKQDDYKTALTKWNLLLKERPQNDTLNYFIGVAYLANGNEQEAIIQLKKLYLSNPNSFKNEAAYYLGLAYLKAEKTEEAKKYLIFSNTKSAQEVLLDID